MPGTRLPSREPEIRVCMCRKNKKKGKMGSDASAVILTGML